MPFVIKNIDLLKHSFVLVFLILLISVSLFSQRNTLNNHIGLNVTLSTSNSYSNADSISNYFREFNSWRNATYGANFAYTPPTDTFPKNWPTRSTADLEKTSYKYNFDSNYSNMYNALSKKNNTIFPSFTLMHHFLTTTAVVNNFTGEAKGLNYISQQSLQRKPVPHVLDTITNTLKLASNESYTDPHSYRYFSEYVSYLAIVYGQNIDSLTKQEVYIDADIKPFLGKNTLKYIEFVNEPDAWWTWSAIEGYYQPKELAVLVSSAYDGHGGSIKTDIYNNKDSLPTLTDFNCGSHYHSPNLKIVSPGLHEMNLPYFYDFISNLDSLRAKDSLSQLDFDIYNFHHYSAYKIHDLDSLIGKKLSPEKIVNVSMQPKKYALKVGETFVPLITVVLEATISGYGTDKIWIHPELDGYKLRGKKIRHFLDTIGRDTSSEIWISEWGYPSKTQKGDASYYGIDPELAHCRWMVRGFMEYQASGEIDKSFWHWYQDTDVQNWDNHCGFVTIDEKRKKSWYYLKILRDQIGDKEFFMMHDIDNCGDNFAWGIDLDTVVPIQPDSIEQACPRIYQYNGSIDSTIIDDVWTLWIPSAADITPQRKIVYLDNIINDSTQITLAKSYSIVDFSSVHSKFDTSSIDSIQITMDSTLYFGKIKLPILKDLDNRSYITPKISDEPIFIHFYADLSNIVSKFSSVDTNIVQVKSSFILIDTLIAVQDTSFITLDSSFVKSQKIFINADTTFSLKDTIIVTSTTLITNIDSTIYSVDSLFHKIDTLCTQTDSIITITDSTFIFSDSLITLLDTFTQTTQLIVQTIDTAVFISEFTEIQIDTSIFISDTTFRTSDTVKMIIDTIFYPIITSTYFPNHLKQNPSFSINPNPVQSILFVDFKNLRPTSQLVITDILGNEVQNIKISPSQNQQKIPIQFEPGIYFCRLESHDVIWKVIKLVVL